MSRRNAPAPFRDGFAALWQEPALFAAELTWRWCFGLSALVLVTASIALYLDSLTVSSLDQFLISTLQPQLVAGALRHIFQGHLWRLLLEQTLLGFGLIVLWALAATVGRAAILSRLVAMFSSDEEVPAHLAEWHFRPILLLHLLRAAWTVLATAAAIVLIVYGSAAAALDRPLAAALALSFGLGIACFAGVCISWYLGAAPLFCIRNRCSARGALDSTIEFSSRHGGRLFLMELGFFLLRLIWAGTMWLAFLSPLGLTKAIGVRSTVLLMVVIAVVYCAGADYLRLARWGAYVALAEDDAHPDPRAQASPPIEIVPLEGLA